MTSVKGQAADEAFSMGYGAIAGVFGLALVAAVVYGPLEPLTGAVVGLIGAPVALVAVPCLLGVWLGYDDYAAQRGAEVAFELNRETDDE